MKKIIKDILGWIVHLAVLAGLIYGIPKAMAKVLRTPFPMASITSGSMWPSLKKGDLILIKGIESKDEIKEGSIVVYKNEKGFTVHRVLNISEDWVTTKGDANNVSDNPVKYEDIVGTVLNVGGRPLRVPLLGSISIAINQAL